MTITAISAIQKFLGIIPTKTYFGDLPDNETDKHSRLELIHWPEKILKKVNPDLLLTHHRYCTNIDHQYCHEAAVIATRQMIITTSRLYVEKYLVVQTIFAQFSGNLIFLSKLKRKIQKTRSNQWKHIKEKLDQILIQDQERY